MPVCPCVCVCARVSGCVCLCVSVCLCLCAITIVFSGKYYAQCILAVVRRNYVLHILLLTVSTCYTFLLLTLSFSFLVEISLDSMYENIYKYIYSIHRHKDISNVTYTCQA
jgi:hypothetical protein